MLLLLCMVVGSSVLFFKNQSIFYRILKDIIFAAILSLLFICLLDYQADLLHFSKNGNSLSALIDSLQEQHVIDERMSVDRLLKSINI
ncbi:hypothetical protein JZO66_04865 [Enterococcus sp. DIV0242_7C1]|uniref:Uncharacterized protein n=1 Tax=Candidatus Enterococcus dunnyi TaxID=1834192 RepID=A0A200J6M9_9ENTE|nr:hypothetical protein [Enterococcus sp. DIV0242_7C1]MBO0469865.1 hypothetical protein [Enterococcus sp. DIV0242_7C1]OUZ32906.1 hypothetical protein A5889_001615 [Enterococcus sp. 9D6_DIV0238]